MKPVATAPAARPPGRARAPVRHADIAAPAGAAPPRKPVGALSAGLAVLRHLGRSGGGAGVNRIARDLGLNPSTCFNLLRTLAWEGVVSFDPADKTYRLGPGAVELARGALEPAARVRQMRLHLEAVASRHRVTVTLWQRVGDDRVVLIDRAVADAAMQVHMPIGQRLPLHVGALGRCMAAQAGLRKAQLREAFRPLRWESPPSFEQYWRSVRLAAEQGWAADEGNFVRGATTVAAVVPDADGRPAFALSAVGFSDQFTPASLAALGEELRDRARAAATTPVT